ncbi:MAG: pilin [Candidatus Paceibacterota bacterium]
MIHFLKKNLNKIALIIFTALMPVISFAATNTTPSDPNAGGKIIDPLGNRYTELPDLIKTILEGAVKIGIPIVALAIIYCGFLFVFARGNPEKLTKAKDALLWSLVGAAILLGAWAIAKMIQATVLAL